MLNLCKSHQWWCWSSLQFHWSRRCISHHPPTPKYFWSFCVCGSQTTFVLSCLRLLWLWLIHCDGRHRRSGDWHFGLFIVAAEERNMRRQGDDSTRVGIRQGHRYRRETDWNPDSVTGARNGSAEMENLWFDMKACREGGEWVLQCLCGEIKWQQEEMQRGKGRYEQPDGRLWTTGTPEH